MQSATLNRKKLAAILELVGSDKPGERQAAAEAAHRMIQAAGLRWDEILAPSGGSPPPPRRRPPSARELLNTVLTYGIGHLSDWEAKFVGSVRQQRRVSRKQYAILARLAGRVRP